MQLHTFSSPSKVLEQISVNLNQLLEKNKNKTILLMVSGGSSLDILDQIDPSNLGPNIMISVLDERFSNDPQVNNWLQVKAKSFFQKAQQAKCQFMETVPGVDEKIEDFSKDWEERLRAWVKKNPNRVTIATLGVGNDGHIAGISPFPDQPERFVDFLITSDWIKGYVGNLTPPERVTVTAKFLEDHVDFGVVYIVGEGKKMALENILKEEGRMAETPARILREMKNIEIFTDQKVEL